MVTVDSGATVGGSGIVGGSIVVTGTLSPGSSAGTLSFLSDLEIASNGAFLFEGGDLASVGGNLTLADDWTLSLSGNDLQDGGSVTIFSYGGLLNDNSTGLTPIFDISGLNFTPTSPLSLTDTGSSIVLNGVSVAIVPEPSALAILGIGGLLFARQRRAARRRAAVVIRQSRQGAGTCQSATVSESLS